ncbi:hypothetical protein TUM20983_20370 [Mycobacterium antarcticum]|uniref:phage major capsid protein n=1 Tax=Mycolicibacterium sp. TUM20983 TaxID=3023369 RepID=UPI00239AF0D5|nr:phage major capsid protein [Mycolicibacterium sp. TUM20983]GLP74927.1 hypothetical protein TUM20983_20370 [Mycolicibacterium sp. TUM20983]
MPFTVSTPTSAAAWRPDEYTFAATDVIPDAVLLNCTTNAGNVEGDAVSVRVACVDDALATITAEGSTIDEAQPELSEALVHTSKVTQLVRLSREQYQQPSTPEQLAQSVSRAVTRRANLAFLTEPTPTAPAVAPVAGLLNTVGIVDGGTVTDSLDVLIDLVATLQTNLATPSSLVLGPRGWAALRKLKSAATYNTSLLGSGTEDAQALVLSLPVIVTNAITDHSGLVIDKTAIVSAVGPVVISTSMDRYFDSDSVGVSCRFRSGFAVPRPDRIGVFSVGVPQGS